MLKRMWQGLTLLRKAICLDDFKSTKRDAIVVFFYGLAVIFICSMIVLPRMGGTVFFSWDSASYIASANEYLENDFGPYLTAAYTQSLGNIASLPFNFHLQPEARLAFVGGRIDPVLFYTVMGMLFYISTYAVGVTFGFGAGVSAVAGIVFPLLTLPFTSPPIYTEAFWWHFPLFGPGIYLWSTLAVTYYLMGRLDKWRNVVTLGIFILAVLWAMLAYAKIVFVLYTSVALFCVLFTLGSESWKELAWKIMGTACTIVVIAMMGPLDFLRGLYGHASNGLFTTDYLKDGLDLSALLGGFFYPFQAWRDGLFWLNLVWVKYLVGYPIAVLSLIGAGTVLLKRRQPRASRLLAAGLLLTYPFSFAAIYGSPVALDVFHLMVLFTVILVSDIAVVAWRAVGRLKPELPAVNPRCPTVLALATAVVMIVFIMKQNRQFAFPYPPSRTELIGFLESNIRFGIGDRFRGRYVNLEIFADKPEPETRRRTSLALMERSARTGALENNDYFLSGLRYFDIPATIEYNRWATPVSVVFMRYLFGQNNEVDRIDLRVLSRFDSKLMRMLGVRYVLSQYPLTGKGIFLAFGQPVKSLSDARLYELFETNAGQYSVQEVRISHDFKETLRVIADEGFDPRHTILLHGEVPTGTDSLEPVEQVVVTRISDGLRVRATSRGKTLLLLPFEFSHCLEKDIVSGSNVRLERANLMLTALQFERSVDMRFRFRFGPFTNADCRMRDMAEIRALGLTAAGLEQFAQDNPGRLLFDGLH